MKNHLARRGGIWWVRLVVPARLREAVGRREFTKSTRTHDLCVAKLVANVMLAEWRKQLIKLDLHVMNPTVLKLLGAAPALAIGGTITIEEASHYGVSRTEVLRVAAAGRMSLHCRLVSEPGSLVAVEELELGRPGAIGIEQSGVLAIFGSRGVANALLAEDVDKFNVAALQQPGERERVFVPDTPIEMQVGRLEVSARAVQTIREHMARRLSPAHVQRAYEHETATTPETARLVSKRGNAHFSEAVDAYCKEPSGLPSDLTSVAEQRQRRAGLMLFAEFMGDLPLSDIHADMLRTFRDGPLRTIPAKANHLPKTIRRATMIATIEAIAEVGMTWPVMTEDMQQERMRWLTRLFGWLHQKEWIATNPALSLKGETGLTKADRKARRRGEPDDDETGREPFSVEELSMIFGQSWFATGTGAHFEKPRFWYPFEYWLPALGLFAGCRISEAAQLHLTDVRQEKGIWVLDINEATLDKSLKNKQSRRLIPLHPQLVEMGFLQYCERLRAEGFRRVFPELTWAKTDARYAKEPIRKMSQMLERLGMPRDGKKVFHSLRHNANNALARVPAAAVGNADESLRKFIRYTLMGHQPGEDVNVRHYMNTPMPERFAMVAAVQYPLPTIARLDIDFAVGQVRAALIKKSSTRRGCEDMGPLNDDHTS